MSGKGQSCLKNILFTVPPTFEGYVIIQLSFGIFRICVLVM